MAKDSRVRGSCGAHRSPAGPFMMGGVGGGVGQGAASRFNVVGRLSRGSMSRHSLAATTPRLALDRTLCGMILTHAPHPRSGGARSPKQLLDAIDRSLAAWWMDPRITHHARSRLLFLT